MFLFSYEDGSIRLWDSRTATVIISFNGHIPEDDIGIFRATSEAHACVVEGQLGNCGFVTVEITSLHFLFPSPELLTASGLSEHSGFLLTTGKDALIKGNAERPDPRL
jgi:U3 small nucleolar RNA-associated protein 12